MGASALVVAAAFAVAFAVLVSSSSSVQAHEDATDDPDVIHDSHNASGAPGEKVKVSFTAGTPAIEGGQASHFRISESSTASGAFTAKAAIQGDQFLTCTSGEATADTADGANAADKTACDLDALVDHVTLEILIDADSERGQIFVQRVTREDGDWTVATEQTVTVTSATPPARVVLSRSPAGIDASGTAKATITITVRDAKGNGISDVKVNLITTNGLLSAVGETAATPGTGTELGTAGQRAGGESDCSNSLGCSVTTRSAQDAVGPSGSEVDHDGDADTAAVAQWAAGDFAAVAKGTAVVTLAGAGRSGQATITAVTGNGQTDSVTVGLYGNAASISADADEDTIALGGSTFIVVTLSDKDGNPVSGGNASVSGGANAPAGPTADSEPVEAVNDQVRPKGTAGSKANVPACSTGTNSSGQCAVQVTAQNPAGTDNDAARGTHTVTIAGPESIAEDDRTVTVEIEVAGSPQSITSDAPATVDPLSATAITVTVTDDENERVGAVAFSVQEISGVGAVAQGAPTMTRDGKAKFTYIAADTSGTATFYVTAGSGAAKITDTFTVQVGEAEADEPPAAPSLDRTPSATGFTLVNFSGGSVAELGEALATQCGSGGRAYATDYQGNWVSYIPSAPAVVNAAFNDLFSDGIPANTPLLVGNCGG